MTAVSVVSRAEGAEGGPLSEQRDGGGDREARLEEAVAWYYQAAEAGPAPERAAFLARYPDLAGELASFLDDKGAFERRAGSAAPAPTDATTAHEAAGFAPSPAHPPTPPTSDPDDRLPAPADATENGAATLSQGGPALPGGHLSVGCYEVLDILGRGSMGVVYRARHRGLGHQVALKMLGAADHGDDALARFRLEAAAVARLSHSGVVHLYEFGEYDGQPFFAQGYIDGGSLHDRLKNGPLPARGTAMLLEKLARAVQHAHEHGIIHRDLKPANVLMTRKAEPKVADFGLAKDLDADQQLSRTGHVLGTPAYMAPEQAAGHVRAVGPARDVYALGVILYECLTGRVPFRAPTTFETLQLVLTREPVPPRPLAAGLPRDLETICLRCLEKEAGKRYQSAADLADDLGRFLRGEPVAARPVGRPERAWRWCRRNPAVAALLAAVAATLLLGATVAGYFAVQAEL